MWAFATSPYGLALSESRFWNLTFREHHALYSQWQRHNDTTTIHIAEIRASILNAFGGRKPEDGGAFSAEELLPEDTRRRIGGGAEPVDPRVMAAYYEALATDRSGPYYQTEKWQVLYGTSKTRKQKEA